MGCVFVGFWLVLRNSISIAFFLRFLVDFGPKLSRKGLQNGRGTHDERGNRVDSKAASNVPRLVVFAARQADQIDVRNGFLLAKADRAQNAPKSTICAAKISKKTSNFGREAREDEETVRP